MAVRALSPSFPGGSLIEPQRNWIRNATRGEEGIGRRLVRTTSPAGGFGVDFIGLVSFGSAADAGAVRVALRRAASAHARSALAKPPARSRRPTGPPPPPRPD